MDLRGSHPDLYCSLEGIVGSENLLIADEDRRFYSMDIYSEAQEPAAAVVRPGSCEEAARAVAAATGAGFAVLARGGGTSYTGGLLPARAQSVVIDTGRLDRVVEVNPDDGYVVVEVGCTWKMLHQALKPHGVRTPFWGPLSGGTATVGGSLSQNALLLGSPEHGASGETVLGLEVVLADGSLVATGSGSTVGGKPFFRHYGPDLTGLFLGDCGAYGIKVRAVLRLIRTPPAARFASFEFTDRRAVARALAEVARRRLAMMCFGMDPVLARQRMKRTSLGQDVKALKGVVTSAPSLARGVKEAVKVAVAGRSFLDEGSYSAHLVVEAMDEAGAERKLAELRSICTAAGREVENSLPKVLYGDPFFPMTSAIGPEGERWVPVHGIVPLSDAAEAFAAVEEMFARRSEAMASTGVVVGILFSIVTGGFVIEPVFYWPGPRPLYYERVLEPAYLARLTSFGPNPGAQALVDELRRELIATFSSLGACHLQVGKTYPYREGRRPETWKLVEAIKHALDPDRLMNPKTLGLE